jgi:ubiquitin carboxyl-terminal hydrolase 9/24
LEAFVEGEMLEGDNAYFCEKCEKKVNTLKRCCIKRMPNCLFVVLKRFEFNYDLLQKIKINDYCEFPEQLNMSEYS